ncbi:HNH endonuclease [Methylorubrum thiocyanatum]|uniref:HNH endonuclease n=1 Tax=Methylorubrum thiocyanatum TaxID=47958 RepID=UPI003F7F0CB1
MEEKASKRIPVGAPAGFPTGTGQIRIVVDGVRYWAHHLAWLFNRGDWPSDILDHINGRPDDNRIENLRLADPSKNMQNSKLFCTNTSGFKGVSFCRQTQRWRASITKDGHKYCLGRFISPDLAHAAYRQAADRMFGEFARAA